MLMLISTCCQPFLLKWCTLYNQWRSLLEVFHQTPFIEVQSVAVVVWWEVEGQENEFPAWTWRVVSDLVTRGWCQDSALRPSLYSAPVRIQRPQGQCLLQDCSRQLLPGNVNIEKIPGQFWITKTLPIILCSQGRKFDYFLLADFDKTSTLPSSYTRINIETWGGQISPFNIGINIFPLQGQ